MMTCWVTARLINLQAGSGIYIHIECSGVCIAILLKPHTALRRLTGSPIKMMKPFFRETRAVQARTVFDGAPGVRLYEYRYNMDSGYAACKKPQKNRTEQPGFFLPVSGLQRRNPTIDAPALRAAFFFGEVVVADFAGGERNIDFQHLRFLTRGNHVVANQAACGRANAGGD